MTRGSGWLLHNFRGYPGQLVISQGLLPNGARADLAGCAAGSFDHYFRDFGALLANSTRSDTVIRLGWEFNGEMFSWAATNTQQWIQCYRHAALAIRAANPFAVFDWAINAHGTPAHICSGDSRNCYPGDDVVDIIGIDNYDHGPSATSQAEFDRIANAREGLTWQYNFAMSRGKRFSVAEWGIAPKSPYNTTGENPMFIFWMYKWFRAHSANLAYEAYFNHCHDLGTNLFRSAAGCVTNVEAGNMYKMLFRDPAVLPWPDPREF
jgi:beta-mannanase